MQHEITQQLTPAELHPVTFSNPPRQSPYTSEADPTPVAELPHRGATELLPLRAQPKYMIPDHIYAQEMRTATTPRQCSLTKLHEAVRSMYEGSTHQSYNPETVHFNELIRSFKDDKSGEYSEIAEAMQSVFDRFLEIRQQRRDVIAQTLSQMIGNRELYVVARLPESRSGETPRRQFVAGRLVQILNTRNHDRMLFQPAVEGVEGRIGLLPPSHTVLSGVTAPAAR